jgi:hypothetical protein
VYRRPAVPGVQRNLPRHSRVWDQRGGVYVSVTAKRARAGCPSPTRQPRAARSGRSSPRSAPQPA